ncbi:hypothetical protein [Nannocystis radixulma]|uniref:Uncharacterized protein n=1 Tax=Nannocystis radixulma TaxID=2995305 RepID=A0ABT5B8X8_9BACT|nr:hypothetical protein [Nannocystis radixulma]MDC0670584.1 hypothetical protein [Nannocystis radixulma]
MAHLVQLGRLDSREELGRRAESRQLAPQRAEGMDRRSFVVGRAGQPGCQRVEPLAGLREITHAWNRPPLHGFSGSSTAQVTTNLSTCSLTEHELDSIA